MNRSSAFLPILAALAWSVSARAAARPYEMSTLLGSANAQMPFVQGLVKKRVDLVHADNFEDLTTGVLYFASRNGLETAETIQVFRDGGNATLTDIEAAIDIASRDSAIVFAPISGDGVEAMCTKMAQKADTAFLVTLGEPGYTLSPLDTRCASRNILFVTTLNADLTGLGDYASYGPLVRLATPGMDLEAPVAPDRKASFLSDAFGMAVAAGELAQAKRRYPELDGAALISRFLAEAETLPSLRGKIPGAKAILKFAK